jgi:amidohydrolase
MDILNEVKKIHEKLVELRRDFHLHPELSMKEYRTATRIEEELDKLGIEHYRSAGTGVVGFIRGEAASQPAKNTGADESESNVGHQNSTREAKDRVVALRADIDALPILERDDRAYCSENKGVMHACGHDLHNASLLGAAIVLANNKDKFAGTAKLIFQPGEEIGAGAQEMIKNGEVKGVERIFGLHVAPDLRFGQVGVTTAINNAAVDHFRIEIEGKATHVSTPQLGIDALYIAAQTVVALQALVTRTTSPIDPVVIGIGILNSGTSYNIVSGSGVIEGTTRTTSAKTRQDVRDKITKTAQNIAEIYGGSAKVIWTDYTSALINDERASEEVREVVRDILGDEAIKTRPISLGGDNFAEFILEVPGAYAYLGTSNEDKPNTLIQIHNEGFDIDENALDIGAALYARYAIKWLNADFNQ